MVPYDWSELLKIFRKTVIESERPGNPLMIRYILFRCAAWGLYVHHFLRSDYDRALHDHPWPFLAIILKGGYQEVHDQTIDLSVITETRHPGQVLLRPAEWRHRIVLEAGRTSWSLVLVGRRARRWGFFTESGWCWWRQYNTNKWICEDEVIHHGGSD